MKLVPPIKLRTITVVATKPWLTYDAPRWMRRVEYFVRVRVCKQTGYLIDKWIVLEDEIEPTIFGMPIVENEDCPVCFMPWGACEHTSNQLD